MKIRLSGYLALQEYLSVVIYACMHTDTYITASHWLLMYVLLGKQNTTAGSSAVWKEKCCILFCGRTQHGHFTTGWGTFAWLFKLINEWT